MVARFTKCDKVRLRDVLNQAAPGDVEDEVAEHLQFCPSCRSDLELLAGGAEWWSDVRSFLSSVGEAPVAAGGSSDTARRAETRESAQDRPDWSGLTNP